MVSTKQFETTNSRKLRDFAKKFERPAPPDAASAPQPKPRNDIFERMDLPSNIRKTSSLSQVIDVTPDVRYIFLFVVYNVGKLYPSLEQNGRPLLTPSSLVAYCMTLVYGFMLINDYQGRPTPSFWAHDFMDTKMNKTIYETLLRAYVPPFMLTIFHGIADTSDPRRPGLEYFATLAATIFETDFGRIIPPQIFLYAHNMSVEADTSRNVQAAIENLLSWPVFRHGQTDTSIYVGQYFSAGTEDGTYHSWMFQTLNLLFSPVTGKSILRRTNIQEIPCFNMQISIDHSDDELICNPYIMFLNASDQNAFNMNKFLKEFSTVVKADLNGTFQLGAVPDDLSGIAILNHGYSTYAMPTWHSTSFIVDKVDTPIMVTTYAKRIQFLQSSAYSKKSDVLQLPTGATIAKRMFLSISNNKHSPKNEPTSDKVTTFDADIHEHPNVLHLLAYEEGDGPVSYSILCGLKIEFFEIDGTSVPAPNPSEKLSNNNSQYGQGAIPLTHVLKGYGEMDETTVAPLPRAKLRALLQQISIDLYDLSINRLGYVDADVDDDAIPDVIPGFQAVDHIRGFRRMYSKFSFIMGNPPPIGKRRLPLWSPYRIIYPEANVAPAPKTIFMMSNFRAMYGTHVPMVETDAPSIVIPTS